MQFWKSAPYLVHFMRGYKLNERLEETLKLSPSKGRVGAAGTRAVFSFGGSPAAVVRDRSRAPQDAGHGERSARPGRLASPVGAADPALLAARRSFPRQGWAYQDADVLRLECRAGRRQRRPQLRGRAEDDGKANWLLPGSGKATTFPCCASPSQQPASGPVIASFSFFCPACRSPTGRILWMLRPGATARNLFVKPIEALLSASGLPDPAGRCGRRALGMGRAAASRPWIAHLSGGMAGWSDHGGRRRRVFAAAESRIVRRVCRRSPRTAARGAGSPSAWPRRSVDGGRARLPRDTRAAQPQFASPGLGRLARRKLAVSIGRRFLEPVQSARRHLASAPALHRKEGVARRYRLLAPGSGVLPPGQSPGRSR